MKIICCDNEKAQVNAFAEEFSDVFSGDELSLYTSADDILSRFQSDDKPDIVFMDIDLDGLKTGMDYAEDFFRLSPHTKIIYVTAYADRFIHDVFLKNANTAGFLMKPVQREYLSAVLDKAKREIENTTAKKVCISSRNTIITLDEQEILYIESDRHTIIIVTDSEKYTSYEKLTDFCGKLSPAFSFPHKSFAVNMGKIRTLSANQIVLETDSVIPVSRSRYQQFKETYLGFLKENLN